MFPSLTRMRGQGERHVGFEGLYLSMRAGHGAGRELSELLRERAIVEESCSKLHSKLARMATTTNHNGPLVPLWACLRALGDKQAACHLELGRRLHEVARATTAHADSHGRATRQAKEEASHTLDCLQGLNGAVIALQRDRSRLQSRSADLERLRREGAAPHALQRAESKCKKSGEDYRRRLEQYRALRAAFEQRVAATAQKFRTLEESHVTQMRAFLQTYAETLWDTHVKMGHMHMEFQQSLEIHTAEELMRLSPKVEPTTERPGPVELQECNSATMMEGLKKRTKLTFGIKRKDKDSESTGSQDADQKRSNGAPDGFYTEIDWQRYTTPEVDDEGYSIRPEIELNDPKTNCFYSSSDSEEEARGGKAGGGGGGGDGGGGRRRRRRLYVEIKPPEEVVGGPDPTAAAQELRASICNIALPPSPARRSPRRNPVSVKKGPAHNEDFVRQRRSTPTPPPLAVAAVTANQLFPSDPLFGPPLEAIPQAFATEAGSSQPDIWGPRPPQVPPEGAATPQTPPRAGSPPRAPAIPPPDGPSRDGSLPESPVSAGAGAPPQTVVGTEGGAPTPGGDETVTRSTEAPAETEGGAAVAPDRPASPAEARRAAAELGAPPDEPVGATEPPAGCAAEGPRAAPSGDANENDAGDAEETAGEDAPARDSPAPTPSEPQIVVQSPVAPPTMADSAPASPLPLSIRQKIPPTKLYSETQKRPFSPPPGLAPLARAESTSSISSNASASNATTPTVDFDQLKMVWFDRGKFYFTFEGASRGPSPLTLGAHDTLPVAAAFTETVNAYFRAAEQCMVKITGELTISFPSGITKVFSGNPSPAVLSFRLRNSTRLEQLLPNPQLLYSDLSQSDSETRDFWLNMPALCAHLKKLSEQSPSATYYNVDILKYQVSAGGADAAPLLLEPSWRCEPSRTTLRVAFRYNGAAMASPSAITNLQVVTPVGGGVTGMQAAPPATWNAEQNWVLWKIPEISEKSEGGGSGVLQAQFSVADGPTVPATLAAQFVSEGSSLSGVEFELVGGGYRLSLIKKRFATGKYMADG